MKNRNGKVTPNVIGALNRIRGTLYSTDSCMIQATNIVTRTVF